MIPLSTLSRAVRDSLAFVCSQPDVAEAEVFAACNGNLTVRLNYTSHIPSNAVEEPKSVGLSGLGLRVAFKTPDGTRTGFGSEPADLSVEGARRALEKARQGAVHDPEYISLPRPMGATPSRVPQYDPAIMRLGSRGLVRAGWQTVERALEAFSTSEELLNLAGSREGVRTLGLILGGDVVFLQERVAIASTHMPRVQTDQSTLVMSLVTAMVEERYGKGTSCFVGGHLGDFIGQAGSEAARNAIGSMDGQRVPGGTYKVVLGPQPVTELLEWILMPGLDLGAFYAGMSLFQGRLGQRVAVDELSIYDDGAAPGLAASKAITDEGLPTGRTDLIRNGVLSELLSDHYEYQRILHDPDGKQKLGVEPRSVAQAIAPRNGFRTGRGGGRNFDRPPGTTSTNLVVEGRVKHNHDELLHQVGDGLYVGRIWYTYAVNGMSAGDFSGTVVGDSYLIKNGRLAGAIKPNTLRLNDNIRDLLNNITGIGAQRQGVVRWSSDQVTWAPEIALSSLRLDEIGGYMEGMY